MGSRPAALALSRLALRCRCRDAAGVPATTRAYDLRHSYVSLMIAEGVTVVEVAAQAGHSPTMALNTHAHLFDEHDRGHNRADADLIREARGQLGVSEVSVCVRPKQTPAPRQHNIPANKLWRSRIRTRDLFLIREAQAWMGWRPW